MLTGWTVSVSDAVQRKLKKYKSKVLARHHAFIEELKTTYDPACMGVQKTIKIQKLIWIASNKVNPSNLQIVV